MNVIITGASKGIGLALSRRFASAGHDLLLCARDLEHLQSSSTTLRELYPSAKINIMQADLAKKTEVISFGEWCLSFGVPDILINNAGVYLPGNVLEEADGSLEAMINTNLYSAYHLSRHIIPAMIKNKSGHIFNMCSIASLAAYKGGGGYSVSKFALNGFSQNLRLELQEFNIKVTGVFPGAVFTDSWQGFDNSDGRIMEAGDVAEMVFAATQLSPQAVVEDIILRPQKGDL